MSGNQALNVNAGIGGSPPIAITVRGSDWYFTVCAVMFAATLIFMGLSFTKPRTHRLFHYITAAITLTAAIAYFSMGSNLGQTGIPVEFIRNNPKVGGSVGGDREIFYVRYIDWFVTTPLLLLDLLLTAGLPWPTILITILMDEFMIVTGLVGALVSSDYKWGYYVFGCVSFLFVIYILTFVARKHANALGSDVSRTYNICGVLTIFIWFLYPIAWGLAEGGNVIAPDSEAVFYGILDLIAKPVFGALLLWGHRNIDPAQLGLHIHDYDEMPNAYGVREKSNGHHTNGLTGDANGTTTTTNTV
ncbi:ion channel activity [Lambiella insularis]|nr:ion channel activity [Lambiella insularis]